MRITPEFPKLLTIVSLAFSIVFFYSCRKIDKESTQINIPDRLEQDFFKVPNNISQQLQDVVDDIKRQNDHHHFLNEFIRKNGLPVWNKVVANVPIVASNQLNNQTGIGGRLNDTSGIEIFLIPLRAADSSVKTYIACVKDSGKYKYDVYRRNTLTYLDTVSTPVKKFRRTMLSVFGYFEKSINNKDSIFVAGQYQNGIKEVSISFSSASQNRGRISAAKITDGGSIVQICYTIDTSPQMRLSVVPVACVDVYVYGTTLDTGIIGGGSTGSSGSGSGDGGGGGGGSAPSPNYNCPPDEWWCESGEYRFINGVLYTSETYPGKERGFPWAWWETGNYLNANLPLIFSNTDALQLNLRQALYLINNSTVNNVITDFVIENENSDEAKLSANITINAFINGALTDFAGTQHVSFVQQNITNCCPIQYFAYMNAKTAMLQLEHPDWSYIRCYLEAHLEIVHDLLDGIGLVPVVGEIADVANGVIYTIQGQGTNAALSFAATIPIAGWAATGAKWARKAITLTDGTKTALNWYKRTDGFISFGKADYKQFRKLLGLPVGDPRQAHHIIPWEIADDVAQEVIQKAASAKFPFHVQDILNGVPLTAAQHLGSHPQYTQRVRLALQQIKNTHGSNLTPEIAYQEIVDLTNRIKQAILANPNTSIENIIF